MNTFSSTKAVACTAAQAQSPSPRSARLTTVRSALRCVSTFSRLRLAQLEPRRQVGTAS